jgi:23S rRNA (adenine2503-C2)-methyltransferase
LVRSSVLGINGPTSADGPGAAARIDFALTSGQSVETSVLYLPHRDPKVVVCSPSQVGCAFGCKFCGLRRSSRGTDLSADEIIELVDQSRRVGAALFGGGTMQGGWQVSFMGQGEPLANLDAVREAMDRLAETPGCTRFGISTVGIPSGIDRLAKAPDHIRAMTKLQVSLHAATDSVRREVMPGTRGWSVQETIDAARRYSHASGKLVCLNHLLIQGVNDDDASLEALVGLAEPQYFYVKLSALNHVPGVQMTPSDLGVVRRFARALTDVGCHVKVWRSTGASVNAGCGQIGQIGTIMPADELLLDSVANSLTGVRQLAV